MKTPNAITLSQELLYKVKTNQVADQESEQLATYPLGALISVLGTDAAKKAFWINIYNAFSSLALQQDPGKLTVFTKKIHHFSKKQITIARHKLSLNDIEHGMLRRSRIWWSKGYLSKWWMNGFEREFRVDRIDPRVHFALNCGARSCPPIKFYETEKIDEQLDMATRSFLATETKMDESKREVEVTKLFEMFLGDFGGKKGIIRFLHQYGIVPQELHPRIVFKPYDWQADPDPFGE